MSQQGLSDFLAYVKEKGVATHNTFKVEIDIPKSLWNYYGTYGKSLSLICEAAEFPAIRILMKDLFVHGATMPRPTHVQFGDMFLFFLVEHNMDVKKFFDDWCYTIADPHSGTINYKSEYAVNVRIYQLSRSHDIVYGVQLYDAFPSSTYPMQLSYQGNQIHRLPVSFSYHKWQRIGKENALPHETDFGSVLKTFPLKPQTEIKLEKI